MNRLNQREKTMSAQQEVSGDDGRLAESALREEWPISEPLRGRLVGRLGEVLDDSAAWRQARRPSPTAHVGTLLLAAFQVHLVCLRARRKSDRVGEETWD
jgi:hypothetical protein